MRWGAVQGTDGGTAQEGHSGVVQGQGRGSLGNYEGRSGGPVPGTGEGAVAQDGRLSEASRRTGRTTGIERRDAGGSGMHRGRDDRCTGHGGPSVEDAIDKDA